ncbi:hypothetical protein WBG99_06740 [Streptomyces sp. TG1A-60]
MPAAPLVGGRTPLYGEGARDDGVLDPADGFGTDDQGTGEPAAPV